MEFGDEPRTFGGKLKKAILTRTDPVLRKEREEKRRMDAYETLQARKSKIKSEQDYRRDVAEGKQSGGFGSIARSYLSEAGQKRHIPKLEVAADYNPKGRKNLQKAEQKIKAYERREKFGKYFDKVGNAFDAVGSAYDKAGSYYEKKGNKKGSSFGLSESDIMDLAGLGGGGKGSNYNDLAGLSGTAFGGSSPMRSSKRKSKKSRKRSSGRRREPQDWGDLA